MRLLERVVSIVAPNYCISCGREGSLLCAWCAPNVCLPLPDRCYRCHSLSSYSKVCARCRPKTRLSHVWVRTEYEEIAKQLIHRLKFGRSQAAASTLADLMLESLPYLDESTILVHIPTSSLHVRQRGYDQAQRIASQLAQSTNRSHLPLLARLGHVQQIGSKRHERLVQLQGAFRPRHDAIIKGAHIVLVDDVITTGATLEEAARTLKAAGAKRIDAIVFAQTR